MPAAAPQTVNWLTHPNAWRLHLAQDFERIRGSFQLLRPTTKPLARPPPSPNLDFGVNHAATLTSVLTSEGSGTAALALVISNTYTRMRSFIAFNAILYKDTQ